MRTDKRQKTIHYKRAVLTSSHQTLQDLLIQAFTGESSATKAVNRREFLNQDDRSYRLINHHKEYNGMFFGQLIFLEVGTSQALVTVDDDAEFYSIRSITPDSIDESEDTGEIDEKATPSVLNKKPEAERLRREFIDSFLYFGVLDNNVILMQSPALRSRELETHLAWLLGNCVGIMDKNSALILQDKPTEEAISKMHKTPVKTVNLGTPVLSQAEQESDQTNDEEIDARSVKWIPFGMGFDILQAAMGENWLNQLNLEDSLDEANLQVSLKISYLRKTTRHGQRMLDNIATSLRHADEADVTVDLYGGGQIKGDALKLSGRITVELTNGLIDESNLYHQMHDWLVTKISSSEIDVEDSIEQL